MGEQADIAREQEEDEEMYRNSYALGVWMRGKKWADTFCYKKKERMNNFPTASERYYWTTASGEEIKLWDLTDKHILNILRKFPDAQNVQAWAKHKGLI